MGGAGPGDDVGDVGVEEAASRRTPRTAASTSCGPCAGRVACSGSRRASSRLIMAARPPSMASGMRPCRCSVREMACSRSQHGSSTRPSWVTAVSSTAMPLAWAARRRASSHGTSRRSRSAPVLDSRAASAPSSSSAAGDVDRTRRRSRPPPAATRRRAAVSRRRCARGPARPGGSAARWPRCAARCGRSGCRTARPTSAGTRPWRRRRSAAGGCGGSARSAGCHPARRPWRQARPPSASSRRTAGGARWRRSCAG